MIGRFAILALTAVLLVTMDSGCRRIRPPVTMKGAKTQPATQAASQPASRPTTQPQYEIYTIQKGDRLRSIAAKKLGNPYNSGLILKVNPGLDPTKLTVGQKIKLPNLAKKAPPAKP